MTKEQKNQEIADLVEALKSNEIFYLSDTTTLNAEATSQLRRECFKAGIKMRVVKNTLLRKAMERVEGKDYSPLFESLHGNTAVMFASVGNVPARLIKEFRKKHEKPAFKAAFIQDDCYVGADQLEALVALKSKEELLGDILGLLQSPAKNVISALQGSAGNKVAGLVKALEERNA
ncbi:MAG: 50S ribosomal protein L10 [Flavobacteriales bacterium]|nr:50S ribosomal protein L10 [Flavobacteriales bacterium]